jgi:hypothetical protein
MSNTTALRIDLPKHESDQLKKIQELLAIELKVTHVSKTSAIAYLIRNSELLKIQTTTDQQ